MGLSRGNFFKIMVEIDLTKPLERWRNFEGRHTGSPSGMRSYQDFVLYVVSQTWVEWMSSGGHGSSE
jgi:hypothetical protein